MNKLLAICEDMLVDYTAASAGKNRQGHEGCNFPGIVGLDFGATGLNAFCLNLRARTFTSKVVAANVSGLAQLVRSFAGSLFIGEQAHFGVPQSQKSLAQPFTEKELLDFREECEKTGGEFRLAPHGKAPFIKSWAATDANSNILPRLFEGFSLEDVKGDMEDAARIAVFYGLHPSKLSSLAYAYDNFERCDVRDFGLRVRRRSNEILNHMAKLNRLVGGTAYITGGGWFPGLARVAEQVQKRCDESRANDEEADPQCKLSELSAFSLVTLVMNEREKSDEVSFHHEGLPLGWNRWKSAVLGNTPYHFRGGRARSNIWWHGFKSYSKAFFKVAAERRPDLYKTAFKQGKKGNGLFLKSVSEMTQDQESLHVRAKSFYRRELRRAYRIVVKWELP